MKNHFCHMLLIGSMVCLFLNGCGAADTAQSTESDAVEDTDDQTSYSFTMGTVFTTRVIGENASDVISEVEQKINECDSLISWRTEGSVPADFNEEKTADVSDISDLVEMTLKMSQDTDGAFDMTVLPLSELWNFDKMQDENFDPDTMEVPADADIQNVLPDIGYEMLDYDQDTHILSTDNENLCIELGAVGKGYALDEASEILQSEDITGGMISAGSSIYVQGTKDDGSKFNVALRDPRGEETEYIGIMRLSDCTISTSGDYERYFEKDGVRYHHILDPRTGYPADSGLMQVTIINQNGALGDALSTSCFILGLDDGMKLAAEYGVDAIFVDTDRNVWYNNPDILQYLDFSGESEGYSLKEYNQS